MRRIDHVTVGGSRLEPMIEAFQQVGLKPVYGGPHSNGTTHMSALSFADGSYIELISLLPGIEKATWWNSAITQDSGPCAWAWENPDVRAESERLRSLNIPVNGPHYMNRQRPDGQMVEWDLAFVGEGEPGSTFPFIIKDLTPRSLRVASYPTEDQQPTLTGVAYVVIAVRNLEQEVQAFQHVYGYQLPQYQDDPVFGARLAWFTGTPVILAAEMPAQTGWLSARLDRFGSLPCAFLLGTSDFEKAFSEYPVTISAAWFGQKVAWFDEKTLLGTRLGVISLDTSR